MLRLLEITQNPEAVIATFARISRSKKDGYKRLEEAIDDLERSRDTVKNVLDYGHENITESVNLLIEIEGSRLGLRDILLSRLISPLEMSQRYIKIEKDFFYIPKELENESLTIKELFEKDLELKINSYYTFYEKLKEHFLKTGLDKKVAISRAKEDSRYLLSQAIKSRVIVNANLRIWLNLYQKLRESPLSEERQISKELEEIIKKEIPSVYDIKIIRENKLKKDNENISLPTLVPKIYRYKVRLRDYLYNKGLYSEIKDRRKDEFVVFQFDIVMSQSATRQYLRHRIQSLVLDEESISDYVLPPSFYEASLDKEAQHLFYKINDNIMSMYINNKDVARYMLTNAHKVRLLTTLNLRELSKISQLRECLNAQWEIRNNVKEMTTKVSYNFPEFANRFGPKCVFLDYCPEGKNTCGELVRIKEEYKKKHELFENRQYNIISLS